MNFLDETAGVGVIGSAFPLDTDLIQSAAIYTMTNNVGGPIEDYIADPALPGNVALPAGDTLTFTLTSSTNLARVATAGGASFVEATVGGTDVIDNANFAFAAATPVLTSAAIPNTSLPLSGTTQVDDIVIALDGTGAVEDRTFTGSATLAFAAAQYRDRTFALGTTHTWVTNGTILQMPLFNVTPGFQHRFALTNTSGTDGPFTVLVQSEAGNVVTLGPVGLNPATNIIPANTTLVFNATDIATFSGSPRGTVVFTVNGPTTSIQGQYQVVNATPGSVANTVLVRPGTN